ncbi:hypothetical protein PENTCL1PPCAC_22928 [Pristionchus entomophagus]|uniref:peptidylprolyl isomerase n=1 Tax=Pristionchus entomophagus TaxID=358040 RepID=A0AAV5U1R0_9BILA|nr:hypothetical protein PENTCL1PPCAC_22928 [Pristionchus entomophagus]
MEDLTGEGSQGSVSSDGFDNVGMAFIERDIEVVKGRRAISSGEPSLDGSIDDDRGVVSDSDIGNAARAETIAKQTRGPSSDALEGDCLAEHLERVENKKSEWEDVLGSGELMRRIEREGDGERPSDEYTVHINVVDNVNGVDSHEDLEFLLGFSSVIDAWELVVKLMRVGEKCRVKCSPRFAYGEKGLHPNIPSNQYQEYTIELTSSSKLELSSFAVDELTELLIKLKERGNFFFSRQEYEKAIFVYKRAISTWNRVGSNKEDEGVTKVSSALHSNLAVCYAKVDEWKNCLESAESSLELDRFNDKALFRKGQSLSRLGENEEAMRILNEARKMDPKDSAIEKELELAKRSAGISRVKERELYRKMLSGISSEEEVMSHENDKKIINRMYIVGISIGVIIVGIVFHFMLNYH